MSKPTIPYYVVRAGNGYWQPTTRMKALGFNSVPCGPDGEEARRIAGEWNGRWQKARVSGQPVRSRRPGKDAAGNPDEDRRRGYVYFFRVGNRVKIGFSRDPLSRLASLKTGLPGKVDLVIAVPGERADERRLHRRLAAYRQVGEWFTASGVVMRMAARIAALGSVQIEALVEDKEETNSLKVSNSAAPHSALTSADA